MITGKLTWPPHPCIGQECWEMAKTLRKGSLETLGAGLTLLLLKPVTPVTSARIGAVRPTLSAFRKPPLTLQFRFCAKTTGGTLEKGRMKKNCSFGAGWGEWRTHKHRTYSPVLTKERGMEQSFAELPEGSEHCQVPRKTTAFEIHVFQIRI